LESKQWTLFDYEDDSAVEQVRTIDLNAAISELRDGQRIEYGRYIVSKYKFYEVECANEYHELFHSKQDLQRFLTAKGVI